MFLIHCGGMTEGIEHCSVELLWMSGLVSAVVSHVLYILHRFHIVFCQRPTTHNAEEGKREREVYEQKAEAGPN